MFSVGKDGTKNPCSECPYQAQKRRSVDAIMASHCHAHGVVGSAVDGSDMSCDDGINLLMKVVG